MLQKTLNTTCTGAALEGQHGDMAEIGMQRRQFSRHRLQNLQHVGVGPSWFSTPATLYGFLEQRTVLRGGPALDVRQCYPGVRVIHRRLVLPAPQVILESAEFRPQARQFVAQPGWIMLKPGCECPCIFRGKGRKNRPYPFYIRCCGIRRAEGISRINPGAATTATAPHKPQRVHGRFRDRRRRNREAQLASLHRPLADRCLEVVALTDLDTQVLAFAIGQGVENAGVEIGR